MAQSKVNQNNLRDMLLNNGTVKQGNIQPSAFRHTDKVASKAAAIAARRADIGIKPTVRTTGKKSH
jgi:hypothetical protein